MVLVYTRSIQIRSEYLLQSSHRYFSFILSMYIITDQLLWSGIAAARYHHAGYFDCTKRREHFDDFLGKVLAGGFHPRRAGAVGQPRAAEWFREWWTGQGGRWTLAHAGHAGSNNNWVDSVEVNWRLSSGETWSSLCQRWQRSPRLLARL
jgi:hypothetical protein